MEMWERISTFHMRNPNWAAKNEEVYDFMEFTKIRWKIQCIIDWLLNRWYRLQEICKSVVKSIKKLRD